MEAAPAARTPLETGALVALASLLFAAVVGLVAVLGAESEAGALGIGVGIAFTVFLNGATLAVGLACLARRRAVPVALGAVGAAALATDLFALAVWLEIDDETYAKVTGIAAVWSFFGLVVLGLVLAAAGPTPLARGLKLSAAAAAALAGALSTVLVLTAGGRDEVVAGATPFPVEAFAEKDLLRPLGLALVLLAPLWFGALAASKLRR